MFNTRALCCQKRHILDSYTQYLPPANEVWGKVIFLHLSVILFTGGEYLGRYPPGRYTPWDQVHPRTRYTTWASTPPDQVHPLGRYNPLDQVHPWARYPPRQVHPPRHRACWEIRSMRGRYASYWIAILLALYKFFFHDETRSPYQF